MSGYDRRGDGQLPTEQPPSFKTNVNRQKTKRWVNARSYTYDGDDWGDSDEYGSEEPAAPLATVPDESEPTSPLDSQENKQNMQANAPAQQRADHNDSSKPLPFIRPADIYKRMEEERQKQNKKDADQGTTSGTPVDASNAAQVAVPADSASKLPAPAESPQVHQNPDHSSGLPLHSTENQPQLQEEKKPTSPALPVETPVAGPADESTRDVPTSQGRDSYQPIEEKQEQPPPAGGTELHHNPSLGFRSVVHQAFDAPPETPSTASSILRSDSASTSMISPIIQSHPSSSFGDVLAPGQTSSDQTPTIYEEPTDFKPGHRRSLSPPNSGSAPARKPIVQCAVHPAKSQLGGVSTVGTPEAKPTDSRGGEGHTSPSPTASDIETPKLAATQSSIPENAPAASNDARPPSQTSPIQQPTQPPPPAPRQDESAHMPPALNVGGGEKRLSQVEYDRPALENVSPSSPENVSPDVHDRLRDEIMQSLGSQPSITPQAQEMAAVGSNSTLATTSGAPQPESLHTTILNNNQPSQSPDNQTSHAAPVLSDHGPDYSSGLAGQNEPAKSLKKRFSWEESSVEDNNQEPPEPQQLTINPAIALDTTGASLGERTPTGPHRFSGDLNEEQAERSLDVNPSQEAAAPSPATTAEISPSQNLTEYEPPSGQPHDNPPTQSASAGDAPGTPPEPQSATQPPAVQDHKLLGFRQIMAIEKPSEKIKTFERTRKQFAEMDTGLSSWVNATATSNPDHADLAQRNGLLPPGTTFAHRPNPSRNKFPKLTSLGSLSLQTSHNEGSPTTPPTTAGGHTRHASSANQFSTKINTQQVQAKGKDLLHSAGVLGGKAGGAAKGFFAKGRSKFRNSTSTDKVNSSRPGSSRRRSSSTPSPETQEQRGAPNDQQTAVAAAPAVNKPLPRLLSLKLDHAPFSNDMTTTWEEHEAITATTTTTTTTTTSGDSLSPEPRTAIVWGGTSSPKSDDFLPAPALGLPPKTERNSCPAPLVSPVVSPVDAESAALAGTSGPNGFKGRSLQEQEPEQGPEQEPEQEQEQEKEQEPEPDQGGDVDLTRDMTMSGRDVGLETPVNVQEEAAMSGDRNEEMHEEVEGLGHEEVKKDVKEGVREDEKEEAKELEAKEDTNEEVKEEVKEQLKEEVKEEVKEEIKDEVKDEVKEEVKEEIKAELKDEAEKVNEDAKAGLQEEPQKPLQQLQQPQLKRQLMEEHRREVKHEPQAEPQQNGHEALEHEPQKKAPEQLQPEAQPKVQQSETEEEAESPTDSVDEQRPSSSAALSMVDNRASFMPADYATYTSPPVEEARAVKVIGRKASVITSELRTFISREINIGKKGKMPPAPTAEPTGEAEGCGQPPHPPSGSEDESGRALSDASPAAPRIKPTPDARLSNGQGSDIDAIRHSQPRPVVSPQHVEHHTNRRDTVSSSRSESTEPRYTKVDKTVQQVSAAPSSPPPTSATKIKALPSLPPEDKPVPDRPDSYNSGNKPKLEYGNQPAEQIQSQPKPALVKSTDLNTIATSKPSLPPPVPDTTAQREAVKRESNSGVTEGKPTDHLSATPSVKPPVPAETPSERPTSPPVTHPAPFAGSVREGRSSTQLIREYFSPSGNSSSKPATVQEESRPSSAMANLMSKVAFSRQPADRRASATGTTSERSWSNRFQSFKVDSSLSKTRSASALGSGESQRASSVSVSNPNETSNNPPDNQSPASKVKIHGRFIRGANRLAQNAGEMKKKSMPRMTGLFNRHSRHAQPVTKLPHTPEDSPQQQEAQVTAPPQPQPQPHTYRNMHSNTTPHDYQQQQTNQPQTQSTRFSGRQSITSQQSFTQDNMHSNRSSHHTSMTSHTTVLAHATPPGNPQSYMNNPQLRSQSPMSFIQFQNGHVPTNMTAQHSARTQSPDPTQHPLPDSATMSPAASPPPEGSSYPHRLPQDRNHSHTPPHHAAGPGKHMEPVELPVPIPGDDSSEEIVMSSTAYPGQEWHPEYYMDY
ncbi:hypothetical protein GX51_03928 [Blastomyces parvus]|uniref:Uncharacterized protein n=1 Tax=Blastomyces parvus TaxID=2060905 RepID=A0A2B7WWA5_9EURO|nr:hypothetical protein GX51_03928 [Blastomyces parvus]